MKKLFKYLFMLGMITATTISLTSCGPSRVSRKDLPLSLSEVRKARGYKADLASTGKIKALVLPIEFSDYPCSAASLAKYGGCNGIRADIKSTLFGKSEETTWESLSSFYKKSSYGKLNITGDVADWYRPELSAAQYALRLIDDPNNNTGVSDEILDLAVEAYRKTHTKKEMDEFDSDGDGYIDAVYVIYTVPARTRIGKIDTSDLFWAYAYWSNAHSDIKDNKPEELPVPYTYFWASVSFMYEDMKLTEDGEYVEYRDENGKYVPDAHTFIHETGHLMGLQDYYSYDAQSGLDDFGAAGAIDMMDNNVGDHNAYSKMLYGWTEPYYITESTTITLKPFYSSGDFVLLNVNWNGSMFDEYLLIEYYRPEGLNEYDSKHHFAGNYPLVFQEPGVKVYHIDSRLGGYRTNGSNVDFGSGLIFSEFLSGTEIDKRYAYCDIAASNTASRSVLPQFKLIHLLESNGEISYDDRDQYGRLEHNYATDEALFHEGDTFGYEGGPFADFTFNTGRPAGFNVYGEYVLNDENAPGNPVGFKFKIGKMTPKGVTITFEKTANADEVAY
ncbi:MAG: immune inhibitor A [Erysipelotrichales bacterium]|nr:immune inhibitor A [Erysipelotrichales bacterium]